MRRFAELYDAIDRTTSTTAKVEAVARYVSSAPAEDAAWGVYFLMGRRIRRLMKSEDLAAIAIELSGIPSWLLRECYSAVGDSAETISLVLDGAGALTPAPEDVPLHVWVEERIDSLRLADDGFEKRRIVREWWKASDARQVFLLVKLLTGELRVGVSSTLVTRAIAAAASVPADVVAHRLMGDWRPSGEFLRRVLQAGAAAEDAARPYPFYLASPVDLPAPGESESEAMQRALGAVEQYQAEWKWDGIRSQLIRRGGVTAIWSRGEELVTERFPEVLESAMRLGNGTVLDGELLAYRQGRPLAFGKLQTRIGRRGITAAVLADAPTVFMAYDVMEAGGEDVRGLPMERRREILEGIIAKAGGPRLLVSELVRGSSWDELARLRRESRERGVEGIMLKRRELPYGVGRERGSWWKWKIDPYSIDAVLVYAQPGHGRRAGLLTDYTFAVWDGDELTPVAKAYSGLSNEEIAKLDTWIRGHTLSKFGPVRVVEPVNVFEIHFEGIGNSPRHRSGIAVRFPRIARQRTDKDPREADTLESVRKLLVQSGATAAEPSMFEMNILDGRTEASDAASVDNEVNEPEQMNLAPDDTRDADEAGEGQGRCDSNDDEPSDQARDAE